MTEDLYWSQWRCCDITGKYSSVFSLHHIKSQRIKLLCSNVLCLENEPSKGLHKPTIVALKQCQRWLWYCLLHHPIRFAELGKQPPEITHWYIVCLHSRINFPFYREQIWPFSLLHYITFGHCITVCVSVHLICLLPDHPKHWHRCYCWRSVWIGLTLCHLILCPRHNATC